MCRCRAEPSPASLYSQLDAGGARAILTGGTGNPDAIASVIGRARAGGFREVAIRTNGLGWTTLEAAASLARSGATTAIIPILSDNAKVHDRIAGRQGALVQTLLGMRALSGAGLDIELEIALLSPRLARPSRIVELGRRAVPGLRAAWFRLGASPLPAAIAPAPWSVEAGVLAEALDACARAGIKTALRAPDAIPFCALRRFPEYFRAFEFNPRERRRPPPGAHHVGACEGCAARGQCPGVAASYLAAHGAADIVPFEKRPETLYDQRTTPRRRWTDKQREAASNRKLLVLRPTVHCNQDCLFCSANETSRNVWNDPDAMLRVIARAARRGVGRLSFSGGEPTLSRHLPLLVQAARRCGIEAVELVSNGVLLDTPERVQRLVDAGLTHAFVSLHAHDEALSQRLTQKLGDFDRTVRALGLLTDAGVETAINHVITTANYRFLPHFVSFVHERFGGRVYISFAFVTPQYKALENLDLLPRMSEVVPYLERAMLRAIEIAQPFGVGSRQGIPPCRLGPFQAWSDVFGLMNEAQTEDAPQKQLGPTCDRCRFHKACTGLWKPYADRFGFDELEPVQGPPPEVDAYGRVVGMRVSKWRVPTSFEDVPDVLRDREAEERVRALTSAPAAAEPLPEIAPRRSRPLRVVLVGTGRQARRIAREARDVPGLSIDAIASPHAPDGDLRDFGGCPVYRDAVEAFDDMRPEAAIVAAATHAHRALAEAALQRGIPVLMEKPLTTTLADAEALVALSERTDVQLVMAHNLLFATELDTLLGQTPWERVELVRRCPSDAGDAPRTWSRSALYQTLYHLLVLTGRACGHRVPSVVSTSHEGTLRPERVSVALDYTDGRADIQLDFSATEDCLRLRLASTTRGGETTWQRSGRTVTVEESGAMRDSHGEGSELNRMLIAFRDQVVGRGELCATAAQALAVMRACDRVLEALESDGAPFRREGRPKHVASPSLR